MVHQGGRGSECDFLGKKDRKNVTIGGGGSKILKKRVTSYVNGIAKECECEERWQMTIR